MLLTATAALLAGCFNTLDWREFNSEEGHYTVALPGKVNHEKRVLTTPVGNVTMQMDSTSAGDALFGVGYSEYPPNYLTRANTEQMIDQVRDALVKNIGARTFSEAPLIREDVHGRSVHAEGRGGDKVLALDAHLMFAGGRFYQVVVVGSAGPGRISKDALDTYFNSFRITK
jgi:hypothetical protein